MVNRDPAAAVPALVGEHGAEVDRIMGDAIMATFNRRGPADDAGDACGRPSGSQRATGRIAESRTHWPRFCVGVNTGTAIVVRRARRGAGPTR